MLAESAVLVAVLLVAVLSVPYQEPITAKSR